MRVLSTSPLAMKISTQEWSSMMRICSITVWVRPHG